MQLWNYSDQCIQHHVATAMCINMTSTKEGSRFWKRREESQLPRHIHTLASKDTA